MKKILLIAIILCSITGINAQPLSPGDQCPDFEFVIMRNHQFTKAHLSDFKGKMVLLDFWSTNCGPCIAAFPKMESLQKQFGDKVLILPVIQMTQLNDKTKEYVSKFWGNNRITRSVSLPTVVSDTQNILYRSFPHNGVPHEVWIDGDGIVRGITSAAYVTPQNIEKILNKERVDWVVYRENKDFKTANTLLIPVDNGAGMPESMFYSSLTSYLPTGKQNMIYLDSNDRYKKYLYMNVSLMQAYKMSLFAGNQRNFLWNNRFVLEVKDKSRYIYDRAKEPFEEWVKRNAWCYEAVLPAGSSMKDFYINMASDINRFLSLNGRIEKRLMPCYILKRTSQDDKLFHSAQKEQYVKMDEYHNTDEKGHTNFIHSFDEFMTSINRLEGSPIVLNETGYAGEVNIPIVFTTGDGKVFIKSMSDIEGMRKQLLAFGLDFVPEKRELEVFVLTEKDLNH